MARFWPWLSGKSLSNHGTNARELQGAKGPTSPKSQTKSLFRFPCFGPELVEIQRPAVQTRGLENDDLFPCGGLVDLIQEKLLPLITVMLLIALIMCNKLHFLSVLN